MAEWTIDGGASTLAFSLKKFGFWRVRGRLGGIEGRVTWAPDAPGHGGFEARVDAATVDTGSGPRDEAIRARVFEVERFPAIAVRSTGIERVDDRLQVSAEIGWRTPRTPVVLDVVATEIDPSSCRFEATAALSRAALDVRFEQLTQGFPVSDLVTLHLALIARR